jgi:hypothetical protein
MLAGLWRRPVEEAGRINNQVRFSLRFVSFPEKRKTIRTFKLNQV